MNGYKNTFLVWLPLPRQPTYKPKLLLKLDSHTEQSSSCAHADCGSCYYHSLMNHLLFHLISDNDALNTHVDL